MKKLCVLLAILLGIAAALLAFFLEDEPQVPVAVWLREEGERIRLWEQEAGHVVVFLPGGVAMEDVILRAETQGQVMLDGRALDGETGCGGLMPGVDYLLTYPRWRGTESRMLRFVQGEGVPTLYLTTESGSLEKLHARKDNKEKGNLTLRDETGELLYSGAVSQISGRGNYTWEAFEKKPYSLELAQEADLLGLGKASRWVLLANAADPSYARNKAALDFAEKIGMAYTPGAAWVNVYANGQYIGLYLLTERNEIHPERVNIARNGGFLVSAEVESRLVKQGYTHFRTDMGRAMRVHGPETAGETEIAAFAQIWNAAESAIMGRAPLETVLDLDSWVKRYLMDEIFANVDGGYISQYFYYDPDQARVFAGPVWDFDLAMGSPTEWQLRSPRAFYANWETRGVPGETLWFAELYQNETFRRRLEEIYKDVCLPALEQLTGVALDEYMSVIAPAARMDSLRWHGEATGPEAHAAQIRQYLEERMAFLSSAWLEGQSYCQVRAYGGAHTSYAYYAVEPGQRLEELPVLEDTETHMFLGWYDEKTGEPFDPEKPIREDTQIYGLWQEKPGKKLEQLGKLLPAGAAALLFVMVLAANVRRMRKGG